MRFQNSMNREVIHRMKKTEIRRGDIFSYDFGTRIGSIQSGVRPVLVIQADNFNANAPTVIVASITSVIKKRYLPSHIILGEDFGLTKPSMVLLEQIQTVNKDDLTEYIGFVDDERLWRQINAALKKTFWPSTAASPPRRCAKVPCTMWPCWKNTILTILSFPLNLPTCR